MILLDDAFQHRKVQAGLNLLLTSYSQLYTNDFLLPVGSLRDIRSRAHKAQVILVTKCPNLSEEAQQKIIQQLQPLAHQQVFFTRIAYAEEVCREGESQPLEDFLSMPFTLVTGIANPTPLVSFLQGKGAHFTHLSYSDHHHFSEKEIASLSQHERLLTTEKDYVRFGNALPQLYYLPIKTQFLNEKDKEAFDKKILSFVFSKF